MSCQVFKVFDGNHDLKNLSNGVRDGPAATDSLSVRKVSHLMGNATAKNKVTERGTVNQSEHRRGRAAF